MVAIWIFLGVILAALAVIAWELGQMLYILRYWRVSWSRARSLTATEDPPPAKAQAPADKGSPLVNKASKALEKMRSEAGYES